MSKRITASNTPDIRVCISAESNLYVESVDCNDKNMEYKAKFFGAPDNPKKAIHIGPVIRLMCDSAMVKEAQFVIDDNGNFKFVDTAVERLVPSFAKENTNGIEESSNQN